MPPARIQAIDVSRRGLHDEGSVLLRDKLLPKIIVDDDTNAAIWQKVVDNLKASTQFGKDKDKDGKLKSNEASGNGKEGVNETL